MVGVGVVGAVVGGVAVARVVRVVVGRVVVGGAVGLGHRNSLTRKVTRFETGNGDTQHGRHTVSVLPLTSPARSRRWCDALRCPLRAAAPATGSYAGVGSDWLVFSVCTLTHRRRVPLQPNMHRVEQHRRRCRLVHPPLPVSISRPAVAVVRQIQPGLTSLDTHRCGSVASVDQYVTGYPAPGCRSRMASFNTTAILSCSTVVGTSAPAT